MFYKTISEQIKNNNGLVLALNVLDKAITYITVIFYVTFLVICFLQIDKNGVTLLYRSILVPSVSFVIVSIFRRLYSSPRPYEVYDFTPAIKKETVGKSFPSRHVFSIFIIAFTIMQEFMIWGIIISMLGVILATIRVVTGIHFIKDVVASFVIALLVSIVCFTFLGGTLSLLMLPF